MRWRFKSILLFIVALIFICGVVGIGYFFYSTVTGSEVVADGAITINYIDGRKFKASSDSTIKFSVTNSSDELKYYYIKFSNVLADDVTYELKSNTNLKINKTLKSEIVSNQVAINAHETVKYEINFKNNGSSKYSGVIEVGLKKTEDTVFADAILDNNKINEVMLSKIPDGSKKDEGLIALQDDSGIAYYFRGSSKNNNVSFANMNWKIVKINGDGSIKLVLNGVISDQSKYNEKNDKFEKSNIKKVLDAWFENNLVNYSEYIANYNFCNDNTLEADKATYNAYDRILTDNIPTFVCLGNKININIGLLTADEVSLAGATTSGNDKYYLYNSSIKVPYFTMTSAKSENGVFYPYAVDTNGALVTNVSANLVRGVRPVINIIKNAKVTGKGTKKDPYVIIENK